MRQSSSCDVQGQEADLPTDSEALLQDQIGQRRDHAAQEGHQLDVKRSRLAQLARKQDHYATILSKMEDERNSAKIDIARYCAAIERPKSMPSNARHTECAMPPSTTKNCMSHGSGVKKSKGMGVILDARSSCMPNCGEYRKYKMYRCWWYP